MVLTLTIDRCQTRRQMYWNNIKITVIALLAILVSFKGLLFHACLGLKGRFRQGSKALSY